MKLKLKRLKQPTKANVRLAIEHVLQYKLNHWISPRRMCAYMIGLGAEVSEETVTELMDDIYMEAIDCPWKTYIKGSKGVCYKCVAYSLSN